MQHFPPSMDRWSPPETLDEGLTNLQRVIYMYLCTYIYVYYLDLKSFLLYQAKRNSSIQRDSWGGWWRREGVQHGNMAGPTGPYPPLCRPHRRFRLLWSSALLSSFYMSPSPWTTTSRWRKPRLAWSCLWCWSRCCSCSFSVDLRRLHRGASEHTRLHRSRGGGSALQLFVLLVGLVGDCWGFSCVLMK